MEKIWPEQFVHRQNISKLDIKREMQATRRPGVATAAINYYRNIFCGSSFEKSTEIQIPTLVLWGEQDFALGKELVADATFGQSVTVQYFFDASHWFDFRLKLTIRRIQQDIPSKVNQAIWQWLKKF